MNFCKLQIGCLFILLYIIILYIRQSLKKKIPCHRLYDALLIVCPWAIIFDGLTAVIVNCPDLVSDETNRVLHTIFFVLMNTEVFLAYLYMLDITKGLPKKIFLRVLNVLPFAVSLFLIFYFFKDVKFLQGKTTAYSMGVAPISCFIFCFLYFFLVFVITLTSRKNIGRRKYLAISTIVTLTFLIMIIQMIFPEMLITSVASVLLVMGFYLNVEDPFIQRLGHYFHNVVMGFSTLVENRDNNTGGHILRTRDYVWILLRKMKKEPAYYNIITKDFEIYMLHAAPMHDIGKISTPDYILQKPGKLTDEEYVEMKKHAVNGGEIIKNTFSSFDDGELMEFSYKVARYHHEKWNGKGYPEGLKGEEIPLCARIMAIADVFDAVSAKRCYRDALPLDVCFKIIEDGTGTDFDPVLARLFLEARDEITEYYQNNYREDTK